MQASQIRQKYKKILEQSESEDSQDEWEIAYSQMAKQRKKRILTQASPNSKGMTENDNQQNVYNIKQKLAQSLSNCKNQSKEIDKLKKQQLMHEQDRIQWREQASQLNKIIQQGRQTIKRNLQNIKHLQGEIVNLNIKLEEISMDRQLQQKQSEYYKAELNQIKENYLNKEREYKHFDKQFKLLEKIKKQNDYLKSDVERLSFLIEDSVRFGKISGDLLKKHFLGKPYKELQYWYPQQLIGQIQHFLKKNQIGYGNKEFTSNLIKFIEKLNQKSKQNQVRLKTVHSVSKSKEYSSVKKHSKIVFDTSYKKQSIHTSCLHQDSILRPNTNSFSSENVKAINSTKLQSQIYIKSSCWDIIVQCKSIIFQLLLQKEIKRKKIKKIIDSMCNSIMQTFDSSKEGVDKNEFSSVKIMDYNVTSPFK